MIRSVLLRHMTTILQRIQSMLVQANKGPGIVFDINVIPMSGGPLDLIFLDNVSMGKGCVCLYFGDPITDEDLPSAWVTSYPPQCLLWNLTIRLSG